MLMVEMAGNIIPAIASTNAIVAGLCALQARHILLRNLHLAKMVFIARRPDQFLVSEGLKQPNPHCEVCGIVRAELQIPLDLELQRVFPRMGD
jgi:ubiquitin-like 1-activating enzyme E1 B